MKKQELEPEVGGDEYEIGDVTGAGIAIGPGARTELNIKWQGRQIDLVQAAALLAEMPLDTVPEVGNLPRGSRMVLGRNELFTGREEILKELAQALKGDTTSANGRTVAVGQTAVTGMGGIGKTQLAAEFVYCYGRYFAGGVHWLSFAEPESIPAEVVQCGLLMELRPNFGDLVQGEQVAAVRRAWQEPVPRLLVFDNVDGRNAERLLAEWRPVVGGSRILITSRRENWDKALGVEAMSLGLLSRSESVTMLTRFRPNMDISLAAEIAEELGDLPLALHLAGSYLKLYEEDVTAEDYLQEWRRERIAHESMAGRWIRFEPTGRELHLFNTFMLSWQRLRPQDEVDRMAIQLAARAACFAPGETIPWKLLSATIERGEEDSGLKRQLRRALLRLQALGLAEEAGREKAGRRGESGVVIHRLVIAFLDGLVERQAAIESVERTMAEETRRINALRRSAPVLKWQLHLRYVADSAVKRGSNFAAALANTFGYHLLMTGDYERARLYLEKALDLREEILGPEHLDTARSLIDLGELLYWMGEYESAREPFERALAIREKILGLEHQDTAQSMNDVGLLLQSVGKHEEALSYNRKALAIREKVLGPEHPDTAESLNNLGLLLQRTGEYVEARLYHERALAVWENVFGPVHRDTAISLNNLGGLLEEMGQYREARNPFERALAIREEILGPEHPDTATSLSNLGYLLHLLGEYDQARTLNERALVLRQEVLGPQHPSIAISYNKLGEIMQAMGEYQEARSYYERALAIQEKLLGARHPRTAQSLNNLGELSYLTGEYRKARKLLEQSLAIRQEILGIEHPETARSLNNWGLLLQAKGDCDEARRYLERALEIRERSLGPEHPHTADSLNDLGMLLWRTGDSQGSRKRFERALAIRERVFGIEHPETVIVRENLKALLEAQQNTADKLER